jgi:hypothetical protein
MAKGYKGKLKVKVELTHRQQFSITKTLPCYRHCKHMKYSDELKPSPKSVGNGMGKHVSQHSFCEDDV